MSFPAMSFQKYCRISCYGMLLSGFMALLLTGQVDVLTLALYAVALAIGAFLNLDGATFKPPKLLLNNLVLLYAIFFVLDYLTLSHDFRMAAIRLLFFISIFKLYTMQADRDYMYLVITSFLQLLVATTMTIHIFFLLSLVFYLISSIAALILFEIRRTARRTQRTAGAGKAAPIPDLFQPIAAMHYPVARPLLGVTLVLVASILIVAVPIFFVIPRLSVGLLAQSFEQPQLISGFSDRVRLGDIGNIKQNPTIVMRVKVSGIEALPATWKWRGVALDRYDGTMWTQSVVRRTAVNAHRRSWPSNQQVFTPRTPDEPIREPIIEQTVLLEALNTNVLFTAGHVVAITSSDIPSLMRDTMGTFLLPSPPPGRLRYTVAAHRARNPEAEASRRAPDYGAASYLTLPPSLDARVGQLAAEITKESIAPYDKARAIETYLKTRYAYSLNLKRNGAAGDPLAQFLFTTQTGHCEYFASAMAVMLRSLHIPSRLVNGFRVGEFNPIGDDYIVRQSDAHSWVEAYFADYGWVEFDPTPPEPAAAGNPLRQWVFKLADALELFWADQVINYDLWQQARTLAGALKSLGALENAIRGTSRHWWRAVRDKLSGTALPQPTAVPLKAILAGLAGLSALIGLLRGLRRRPWLFSYNTRRRQNVAIGFYSDMLRMLGRYGIEKPKHQTPLEFCRARAGRRESACLYTITESYHRARYSHTPITAAELKRMNTYLKELKETLRKRGD